MSGIQRREVAYRLFASEFDDATLSHQESDEERAPNYVVTPSGARVNRIFVVGVLTEVESVNEDVLRGRIVDPTGAFVVYAGQYQPDEMAALEQAQPPQFVAVTGKARTFSPDDSDRVYTSIRPESINVVDAETRDRWVVGTAEQTLQRVATYAEAAAMDEHGEALAGALEAEGVPEGLSKGIPLAMQHYETTPAYLDGLRQTAIEATRVVAGEQDEVSGSSLAPGDQGDGTVTWGDLRDSERAAFGVMPVDPGAGVEPPEPAEGDAAADEASESEPTEEADAEVAAASAGVDSGTSDAEAESTDASVDAEPESEPEPAGTDDTTSEPEPETEPATADTESEPEVEAEAEPESEPEVEAEPEQEPEPASSLDSADDDDIGDFEPGDLGGDDAAAEPATEEPEPTADEPATEEPAAADTGSEGMYQMDDEERQQIEEEFGTDFTSGSEVDEPGNADIDTPSPDELAEEEADDEADAAAEPDSEPAEAETAAASADEAESEADDTDADEEPAEDVDLDDYVMEVMKELDDGDGADREELVEQVVADTGSAEADVEDAIQNALIGGQCYEPDDDTLKPI
ncbi:hypothetical protein [Haloarchaeobius amylolyticus]|uniref:hypothetical protein n=1 Tax=Haloarchaeobius amylolyticus TaxID=1198296 RepID=UPI0022709FE4|nr:hypothetical protein [Haloarchaeobius amylolyticus]